MITKKNIRDLIKTIKRYKKSTGGLMMFYVGENVDFRSRQTNVYNEYYKKI